MDKREQTVAEQIAGELRRARTGRGWSQLELAERAALSLNYVSLIERAERLPSVEVLIRLTDVLGITLGSVLGATTEAEDPWIASATALLRALPSEARPVVLGMLRGAADATAATAPAAKGSRARRKR